MGRRTPVLGAQTRPPRATVCRALQLRASAGELTDADLRNLGRLLRD